MASSFTIPARLARAATRSSSPEEARQRVIQLYREWYRAAPEIVSIYSLNMSPAFVRHQIRRRFERNRHVTDPRAIDVLILKSWQEFQETINIWKMPDHVHGILLNEKERPPKTFLQKFYEGRDENAIVPAASGVA
ncbi:nadh dehydrogenase 1 alpha subcomplex subunit 6 [Moniliophthora roreri MCA 2997]|uniref:Nadh dehydrogenase 1 alpha subcomplex subunit 6 n=2 Tax=Moniliophthora roreri TaxID=221103 RepID=V2X6D9_MONRO|nr:nadh dehydrogenase 1 alpha subcomplex subunit 6 [Moniliophthora roreri MCA 2997]KAI3597832.1 nadh dehydrogenase 1 alpha subcomplex subunit 6 [Moniliophthora roreri]